MFALTAAAAEQIERAAAEQPAEDGRPMLRVAAKIDPADGELVYGMGFDAEREDDLILDDVGITILISPLSQKLLEHTTLDFVEVHAGEFQFVFRSSHPGGDACAGSSGDERS